MFISVGVQNQSFQKNVYSQRNQRICSIDSYTFRASDIRIVTIDQTKLLNIKTKRMSITCRDSLIKIRAITKGPTIIFASNYRAIWRRQNELNFRSYKYWKNIEPQSVKETANIIHINTEKSVSIKTKLKQDKKCVNEFISDALN